MSDGNRKKPDRFFKKLFGARLLGHHPPGTGESSTHTPTAASSATSVPSAVAGLNETTTPSTRTPQSTTQYRITPKKPSRGATVDATLKSNPTRQPEPASARERPISTVAGSTGSDAQSLWSRAVNSDELSSQERKELVDADPRVDSWETASAVRSLVVEILEEKKGQQRIIKFREEEVVLRDVGMKILCWLDTKVKQTGDTTVQFDLVHAKLPWAGFRSLLQVDLNR